MTGNNNNWDTLIIGAGPAGMFAAYELIAVRPGSRIVMVDAGKPALQRQCPINSDSANVCLNCQPCSIMCGIGGAGIFSDGILNLRPDIVGGNLSDFTGDDIESQRIVDKIDQVFLKFGAAKTVHGLSDEKADWLSLKAMAAGIKFQRIKQRHLGSENTPVIIKRFSDYLEKNGVTIRARTNRRPVG